MFFKNYAPLEARKGKFMFDVPMSSGGLVGVANATQLSAKGPEMPKHFPILITKTENGFLTEVHYSNAKRVYTDFEALAADLKTYIED
jgi:hypothetical protein